VMLMAAFMPWVIWKVFPLVEAATAAAGVERSPVEAAVSAASLGVAAGIGVSKLAGGGSMASASGGGSGTSSPRPGGSVAAVPVSGGGAPTVTLPTGQSASDPRPLGSDRNEH